MQLPNTKILIIVASVVLVILIVVTLFISSLTSEKPSQQPTLIPTGVLNEVSGDGSTGLLLENEEEPKESLEEIASASAEFESNFSQLKGLTEENPVDTADFSLGYSPTLNEFFVSAKTSQGAQKFRDYLAQNKLQDIYNNFPQLFHVGNHPLSQFITETEQSVQKEGKTAEQKNQLNPDLPSLSFSEFSSLIGSLFYQDTEKVKKALDESNKELEGQTTTGTSQQGGNLPSQPYDGGGTPQLKKIMSVIKAIPGLTWGGVCANPAAGGHIPNSEHYHCNAVDVFGSETILDNAFADLLAAAKRDELPIHCLIYERHSYSRESNWAQHDYSGASTHDSHIHISGWPSVGGAC